MTTILLQKNATSILNHSASQGPFLFNYKKDLTNAGDSIDVLSPHLHPIKLDASATLFNHAKMIDLTNSQSQINQDATYFMTEPIEKKSNLSRQAVHGTSSQKFG